MRHAILEAVERREFMDATERAIGLTPQGFRFGSARSAQMQVADSSRMPVISTTVPLQRASDGAMYFMPDYSLVGGPDVPGP